MQLINGKPSTIIESAVLPSCTTPTVRPSLSSGPNWLLSGLLHGQETQKLCCHSRGGGLLVGAVELYLPGHGSCKNLEPVEQTGRGARGQCRSGSSYSVEGRHISSYCCQPCREGSRHPSSVLRRLHNCKDSSSIASDVSDRLCDRRSS